MNTAYDEPRPAIDPARANDPWFKFVELVKKSNSLLGAMLENTHLISNADDVVTIGVPKKMSFMFDKVKDPENTKRISNFIETFWNKRVSIDVKLADEKTEKATPKAQADQDKVAKKRSIEQQIEQNPLVQTAQNVFKTQIKSIRDSGAKGAKKGSERPPGKT